MTIQSAARFWFLITAIGLVIADNTCIQRNTDNGPICVCNSTYCDTVPALKNLTSGEYQLYSTSKANSGFRSTTGSFSNSSQSTDATVTISDLNKTHQTILGFGGAITDAAGINLFSLSEGAQELLLQSYYGEDGIEYSIGRVPVGGTDFSTRGYTYCDTEDVTLESFALQPEDLNYKIPFVHRAFELRGRDNIKLFASAWSAPTWMKTNGLLNKFGRVKEEYYELWAQYYIKFFEAYEAQNITFWGVTTQNEPVDGLLGTTIQNNGFTGSEMKTFIKEAFGPVIRNSSYSDLKIIGHDDQRVLLPLFKQEILTDNETVEYLDGIGVHWYTDFFTPAAFLSLASSDYKQLFRLATEACEGSISVFGIPPHVILGSWTRGNNYLNDIITDLEYDFVGWVDWNLALNETGGPNWIDNNVDSPIIVNAKADEFYKQPMFYVLGHFSKFVVTDSVRIDSETTGDVSSVAFRRPDGKLAVILGNTSSTNKTVEVDILGSTQVLTLEANSINTLLYGVE